MATLLSKFLILFMGAVIATLSPQLSSAQEKTETIVAQNATTLPIVESAGLNPYINVPWSKAVRVEDPFEGNFVAVFDRNDLQNYPYRSRKVISLWSRDSIRVLLTGDLRRCGVAYSASLHYLEPDCMKVNTASPVRQLFIKAGDRVLQLNGENGRFAVSEEIAAVLKNIPDKQNIPVRLVLEGGESVDSEIGKRTVAVWRSIY
jgi:hypothetical protein